MHECQACAYHLRNPSRIQADACDPDNEDNYGQPLGEFGICQFQVMVVHHRAIQHFSHRTQDVNGRNHDRCDGYNCEDTREHIRMGK